MSPRTRDGTRSVLSNGASTVLALSRRAQTALQTLADEILVSSGTHFVVSRSDGAPVRTLTFAGTRSDRTLAHQASIGIEKIRFDALRLQAPVSVLVGPLPDRVELTADKLAAFRESIKVADCVPLQLLRQTIVTRNFELTSANEASRLPKC